MKTLGRDFAKLRWHLLLAIITLFVAALVILWGVRYDRESHQLNQAAHNRQQQIENRLKQVRNEEEEIRQKAALFLQLQQAGVFGPEKRLDWTEMLADLQRQLRLSSMEYEFAPQAALESTITGGYTFYKSRMKLRLGLLHEEDLLRFTRALETQARALVVVQACKVAKQSPTTSEREGIPANLTAECELDWITARPAESGKP